MPETLTRDELKDLEELVDIIVGGSDQDTIAAFIKLLKGLDEIVFESREAYVRACIDKALTFSVREN